MESHFPCETKPSVHLDRQFNGSPTLLERVPSSPHRVFAVEAGPDRSGLSLLYCDMRIRHVMLHGLERTDGFAELKALLGIRDCVPQNTFRSPARFSRPNDREFARRVGAELRQRRY